MKQLFLISAIFSFILFIQSSLAQIPPKTIRGGICNGMATLIPKPEIPRFVLDANGKGIFGIVNVQVLIDEKGNVEKAQAVTGHPLMRPVAEKSAVNAKFKINGDLQPVKISCVLVYNFAVFDPKKSEKETGSMIFPGELNDKALILQKPQLPNTKPSVDEEIKVKTIIDLQRGEVVSAEAVSGHSLLKIQAEIAAFQTKFPPSLAEFSNVFGQGFLIFKREDFNGKTIENKNPKRFFIIERGVINDRAKILPKPNYPPSAKNSFGLIKVQILVDMNGKVVLAKAVSGHPLLKYLSESAARETKFAPTLIDGGEPFYVKAFLLYKFNSNRTVETNLTDKDLEILNQKQKTLTISCGKCPDSAILLVKPAYPRAASYVKASGSVGVGIVVDENGNVESAEAVSGHPLLRAEAVKAALNSKFQPTYLSGQKVKLRGYIVYNFFL